MDSAGEVAGPARDAASAHEPGASAHEPGGVAIAGEEPDSRRSAALQRGVEGQGSIQPGRNSTSTWASCRSGPGKASRSSSIWQSTLRTQIEACEQSLETMLAPNAERDLLRSLPGVGKILSAVIALEIGDIARFGNAQRLVSYAGLVPAARESAGKKRAGKCPGDCNTYLKWAFVEAANVIAVHHKSWPERHVAQLYARVKHRTKLHGKAAVAVGRHLAEASYWVLSKRELYREPESNRQALSSPHG